MDFGGPVNVNPKNNPGVKFPEKEPFELVVKIVPDLWDFFLKNPSDRYIIESSFSIDSIADINGNFRKNTD